MHSEMPDTIIKCGPWYFLPPVGITPSTLITFVYMGSFTVGFLVTHWLKVTYRLDYVRVIYNAFRKDGFEGARDVLRNLSSPLFRERWANALRTEREQRAVEKRMRKNDSQFRGSIWKVLLGVFLLLIFLTVVVICMVATVVVLQKAEYPKCAHWAVLSTVGSFAAIFSVAFYCFLLGVTPERFVPSAVAQEYVMQEYGEPQAEEHGMEMRPRHSVPRASSSVEQQDEEPRAVEQGMESRPRDSVTRTGVSEEQQDEEPQAEERGMESPLRNSVSRESSSVAPQDLQSPSRGHQMALRRRNTITRTASVEVQQDPLPPVERQRSQTEGRTLRRNRKFDE